MLTVRAFTFNPFSENTYLITNEKGSCWIVDPGMYDTPEITGFINLLTKEGLTPRSIINTHAHIDHIFGVQALVDRYSLPFGVHPLEKPVLNYASASATMYGLRPVTVPPPDLWFDENTPLDLEGDELRLLFTPGHSPGSVCFYYPEGSWLIGGDVLFAGSIGRSDLPGGNHDTLLRSIRTQLLPLPDNTTIYSGHGPATTIGDERYTNPFLQ
jgi:glyoxylase-like metal-dependent hydrolase (beta-lactamase superfamily II)